LAGFIIEGKASEALHELNELAKSGKDLSRLVSDLLSHFRNLMMFQVSKGDLSLIDVSEAEAAALGQQATQAPPDGITRIMEVLSDAEGRLRDAASKKIFLEITLLKAIEARNALSIDAVLKKLQQLRGEASNNGAPGAAAGPAPERAAENRVQTSTPERPVTERTGPASSSNARQPEATAPRAPVFAASSATSAPAPLPAVAASAGSSEDLENLWSQLVEAVGRVSPFMRTYLLESHPVSISKTHFTIGFDPEFKDHLGLVDNQKNRTILETKLHELGHRDVSIRFVPAEAPLGRVRPAPPAPASAPQAASAGPTGAMATQRSEARTNSAPANAPALSKEDFKDDPLIKKALEIFKGTIVEVRA
jgi:DNA polymerase-3 subunit gamma/tau